MKKVLIIGLVAFLSCSSDKEVPAEFIQPQEFIDILYEMEIIDAIQIQNTEATGQADSTSLSNYKQLFAAKNISKEEFNRSFQYYQKNYDLMLEITDSLKSRIARNEETINKELRNLRKKKPN